MKTIVVDLDGRLKHYDPVQPFFYSSLAAGKLIFLALPENLKKKNQARLIYYSLMRQQWLKQEWQLLVLLPLKPCQCVLGGHPTQGESITNVLRYWLDPLYGMNCAPFRTVLLFHDTVERYPVTDEPIREVDRHRYHVDRHGYIDEPGNFSPLFSRDDLDALYKLWPEPIIAGDIDHHPGQAKAKVSEELQKKLNTQRTEALTLVEDLISRKKEACRSFSGSSPFAEVSLLDQLEERFRTELEAYCSNIGEPPDYTPRKNLKELLRNTYSVAGLIQGSVAGLNQERTVTVLRFQYPEEKRGQPDAMYTFAIVVLALIAFGTEIRLPFGKQLLVDVEPDQEMFQHLLVAYRAQLQALYLWLQEEAEKKKNSAQIQWAKGCGPLVTDLAGQEDFKFQTGSSAQWSTTINAQNNSFRAFLTIQEEKLRSYREAIGRKITFSLHDIEDLGAKEQELDRNEETELNSLVEMRYTLLETVYDWPARSVGLLNLARRHFAAVPCGKTIFWLVVSAITLLVAPYAITLYWEAGIQGFQHENGQTMILMLLLAFMPLFIIKLVDARERRALRRRLLALRDEVRNRLKKAIDDNAQFLGHLCELALCAINRPTVHNKRLEFEKLKLVRMHFIKQIRIHQEWIGKLGGSSAVQDSSQALPLPSCDLSKPTVSQTCFFLDQSTEQYEPVNINMRGATNDLSSPLLRGVNAIRFEEDVPFFERSA